MLYLHIQLYLFQLTSNLGTKVWTKERKKCLYCFCFCFTLKQKDFVPYLWNILSKRFQCDPDQTTTLICINCMHFEFWCCYNVSCTGQIGIALCTIMLFKTTRWHFTPVCRTPTSLFASRQQRAPVSADLNNNTSVASQPRACRRSQMALLQRATATSSTSWW